MSQIRQNIATKEWVIIATERAQRPHVFAQPKETLTGDRPEQDRACPFCPGNEEPPPIEQFRIPSDGPWEARVVTNKYPALQQNGNAERHFDGIYRWLPGTGYHEVIVESRRHNTCLALARRDEAERTLNLMLNRGTFFASDTRIEHVIYFENHGRQAGTSLDHPHAQIVGLPMVPYNVRSRIEEARRYFDDTGHCVYCQMLADEEKSQERLLHVNEHCVAFIPYAAFSPFHTWIIPRRHTANFLEVTAAEIAGIAEALQTVMLRVYRGLRDPDYNIVLRTGPLRDVGREYVHWYITIIPRVTQAAGFEMGSGMFINTALPEESAAFLRGVTIS